MTATGAAVPVLLYHAVTDTPGRHIAPFTVGPDEFARHMDVVAASGRTSTTFGDLLLEERGGQPPGRERPPVVVTFDDGYADFAGAALPVLLDRGLSTTIFLTTGWLAGRPGREPGPSDPMLAWAQLPELLDCGVELGAHSHRHPQLDTLSRAELVDELVRPREQLEDAIGRPVEVFAYPHGYNGPRVRRAAQAAGYLAAAAVRNAVHRRGEAPFAVARLLVTRTTTAEDIARWLDGVGVRAGDAEPLRARGWRAYRRGRAIVRRAPGSDYR